MGVRTPVDGNFIMPRTVLACGGKTTETVANRNKGRPWIGILTQDAECDSAPKGNLECA